MITINARLRSKQLVTATILRKWWRWSLVSFARNAYNGGSFAWKENRTQWVSNKNIFKVKE